MAPPAEDAALRWKVLSFTTTVACSFAIPPPTGARLPVKVSPVAITPVEV
jgi:hypothetical protein